MGSWTRDRSARMMPSMSDQTPKTPQDAPPPASTPDDFVEAPPSPELAAPQPASSLTDDQIDALSERVDKIHDRVVMRTQSDVHGLFQILGSKRRLLFVNFMSGLARGAGFFLGATLIGGLLIGALAMFVDTTARAMGFEDVTFRSLMRVFAEKAAEAQKVWEDVADETKTEQTAGPDGMPPGEPGELDPAPDAEPPTEPAKPDDG